MMTILSNEVRPANPDHLILRGLKKSARKLLTLPATSYVLAERKEYTKDTFCKSIIGILQAGRVVVWVLHAPWCHACKFDALTRITSS